MKHKHFLFKVLLLMSLVVVLAACSEDSSADTNNEGGSGESKTVSIATYTPGHAFNSAASGIATVVTEESDLKMGIKTFSSPDAWIPMLNDGEVDLGFTDSTSQWHYKGTAMSVDEPMKNIRTLAMGNQIINVGFVARDDSGLENLKDLEGKKLGDYTSNEEAIAVLLDLQLESVGLSYDDAQPVPVSGVEQGIDLLRSGKVDATFAGAPDAGLFLDVDSTVGIDSFSYGDYSVDEIDEVREKHGEEVASRYPNGELVVTEGGLLNEPVISIAFPTVLLTHNEYSEDQAYEIVKTLFENYEKLQPLFTWLEDWDPETMFIPNPSTPYHEGAIKYFKEEGLWTDEAEEYHQELLAEVE